MGGAPSGGGGYIPQAVKPVQAQAVQANYSSSSSSQKDSSILAAAASKDSGNILSGGLGMSNNTHNLQKKLLGG